MLEYIGFGYVGPIDEGSCTLHAAELLPPLFCFVVLCIWQFVALETYTAYLFVVLRWLPYQSQHETITVDL